jgi:hypothetical protein
LSGSVVSRILQFDIQYFDIQYSDSPKAEKITAWIAYYFSLYSVHCSVQYKKAPDARNSRDTSNIKNANNTSDATIAGRPATMRTSVTKGTPETAGMPATSGMQATAVTPATSYRKDDINSNSSVEKTAQYSAGNRDTSNSSKKSQ